LADYRGFEKGILLSHIRIITISTCGMVSPPATDISTGHGPTNRNPDSNDALFLVSPVCRPFCERIFLASFGDVHYIHFDFFPEFSRLCAAHESMIPG